MQVNCVKGKEIAFGNGALLKMNRGMREISHIHCPLCAEEMLSRAERGSFFTGLREVTGKILPSSKSIDVFRKAMRFLSPEGVNFVMIMGDYARKYPDKTFGEIFKLPEVMARHMQKKQQQNERYNKRYSAVFNQIKSLLGIPENVEEDFVRKVDRHVRHIATSQGSDLIKRYKIAQRTQPLEQFITDGKKLQTFKKLVAKIPLEMPKEDKLLCDYAQDNDFDIMQNLLRNRSVTYHYIDAVSKNDKSKKVCMCEKCNYETGGLPLAETFKIYPEFRENLKRYLMEISVYEDTKRFDVPKGYSEDIRNCVKEQTGVQIEIPSVKELKKAHIIKTSPQLREILASKESLQQQYVRLNKVQMYIKQLEKTKGPKQDKIDRYKLIMEILEEKIRKSQTNNQYSFSSL